jgi:hypothetical protein
MKKKNYMKPATKVVQLQHSQHILAGSYTGIQSTNSSDTDNPDYDGSSSGSISIWDAN